MAEDPKLMEFLTNTTTLSNLLDLITVPATESSTQDRKQKIPYVATEVILALHSKTLPIILRCEPQILSSKLIEFFSSSDPLPSVHLQYVQRILSSLLSMYETEAISMFSSSPDFALHLVKHSLTSTTALDLLLKLLTPDRSFQFSKTVSAAIPLPIGSPKPHTQGETLRQIILVSLGDQRSSLHSYLHCPLFLRLLSPDQSCLETLFSAILSVESAVPTLQPVLSVFAVLLQRVIIPESLADSDFRDDFIDEDAPQHSFAILPSDDVLKRFWRPKLYESDPSDVELPTIDTVKHRVVRLCIDQDFLAHLRELIKRESPQLSPSFQMFMGDVPFKPYLGKGKLSVIRYCRFVASCDLAQNILSSGCVEEAFRLFFCILIIQFCICLCWSWSML
ncbi:hypothetical protein GEMRC1_009423 [Eukaryota sp. GEM-RC1]